MRRYIPGAAVLLYAGMLLLASAAAAQERKASADSLTKQILGEMMRLETFEERKAWVSRNAPSDPMLAEMLGIAAYWYAKERNWRTVRALYDLQLLAAESYDESTFPAGKIAEVKERLLAAAHVNHGDLASQQGAVFVSLQHYLAAAKYFETATERRKQLGMEPYNSFDQLFAGGPAGLHAMFNLRLHGVYGTLGERTLADEYELKAYRYIADSDDLDNYATARTYEANKKVESGDLRGASEVLDKAIAKIFAAPFPRGGFLVPLDSMVHLYRRAGGVASEAGDLDRALRYIDEATKLDRGKKQWARVASDLLQRANVALKFDSFTQAAVSLEAIDALIRDQGAGAGFQPRQLYELQWLRGELLRRKVKGENREGSLRRAVTHFAAAIDIAEKLRTETQIKDTRLDAVRQHKTAYDGLLATLIELNRISGERDMALEALRIAEQASARIFLEDVSQGRVDLMTNLDTMTKLSLRLNAVRMGQTRYALETKNLNSDDRVSLTAMLRRYSDERRQLIDKIAERSSRGAELLRPGAFDLERLTSVLPANARILRYAVSGQLLAAWVITRDGATLTPLDIGAEDVARLVKEFRAQLATPSHAAQQAAVHLGSKLYNQLVQPLLNEATGSGNNLYIVPAGATSNIPFEALVAGGEADGRFLIEDYEITYAPSLSILRVLLESARRERVGPPWLFAVGDPDYGQAETRASDATTREGLLRRSGLLRFDPLPGTREEVESIRTLFADGESLVLLGKEATKERLSGSYLGDYDFVHLAAHGLVPVGVSSEVEQPTLALAPTSTSDGLMTFADSLSLGISAYVTVLSACNTGLGRAVDTEGMLSFTRAMLSTGSDHVLASLWEVSDAETPELMQVFYRRVLAGARPASALREAKLHFLRHEEGIKISPAPERAARPLGEAAPRDSEQRWRWPYFWSAFVLFGGNTPVRFVAPSETAALGSEAAPVKADTPSGQRAYLRRLRCRDGMAPTWKRVGNMGRGPYGNIVDLYGVECQGTGQNARVYMDMYHSGYKERRPIPGFTLVR